MKKFGIFIIALVILIVVVGIFVVNKAENVYEFPQNVSEIVVKQFNGGGIDTYRIEDKDDIISIVNWYNDLELEKVNEKVEDVIGGEGFVFEIDEQSGFRYRDDGSKAYVIVNNIFYQVKNPSSPPCKAIKIIITIPAGNKGEIISSNLEISPMGDELIITALEGFDNKEALLAFSALDVLIDYPATQIKSGVQKKINVQKGAWYKIGVGIDNPTDKDITISLRVSPIDVTRLRQE